MRSQELRSAVAAIISAFSNVCILALTSTPVAVLFAQDAATDSRISAPLSLERLTRAITLDGRVDEVAWESVAPLPLSQFQPIPGGPLRDRSEIRIAHDDEYLYASARFWDSEPQRIRANSLLRDHYAEDDIFNLVIDTFNDRENAVWFIVTPNGTRIDGAISNNAEGPESQWNHQEYDMLWDAVAVRTPDGWSAELRIPLSTLRFEVIDGRATMGLIAARVISRRKERQIFPAIEPTVAVAQFKPSLAAPVTFDVRSVRRLAALTPYVVGGTSARPVGTPVVPGVAPQLSSKAVREFGADLKLGLSSRITLDLTLNTDFAQTEVDDQRANLTRFSLFFPERRQFFLERAGLFDVTTGSNDRIFYSRRIGLGPDGVPVRVVGGGRLVGRIGQWDVGALDLLVDGSGRGPLANAGVIRLRRNVLNPFSYLGVIATTGSGSDDASGVASGTVGLDGTLRLTTANYFSWSAASVLGRATGSSVDESTARASWEYRRRAGLSANAELRLIGERYAPALGFVERPGVVIGSMGGTYGWVGSGGIVQERSTGIAVSAVRGSDTGDFESIVGGPTGTVVFAGGASVSAFARTRREVLADSFRLGSSVDIAPGSYSWLESGFSAASSPGSLARVRLELQAGGFYDGRSASAAIRPAWNLSRHAEIAADVELNRVWIPSRGQRFLGDVVRIRSRFALDGRLSVSTGVQFNRAAGSLTESIRLRYALREGTDLFVLLNDERSDIERTAFGLPSSRTGRYFAVKYRHTIR
jgi:hypothetical protein